MPLCQQFFIPECREKEGKVVGSPCTPLNVCTIHIKSKGTQNSKAVLYKANCCLTFTFRGQPLHSGWVDLCDISKCEILRSTIYVCGFLRSRYNPVEELGHSCRFYVSIPSWHCFTVFKLCLWLSLTTKDFKHVVTETWVYFFSIFQILSYPRFEDVFRLGRWF